MNILGGQHGCLSIRRGDPCRSGVQESFTSCTFIYVSDGGEALVQHRSVPLAIFLPSWGQDLHGYGWHQAAAGPKMPFLGGSQGQSWLLACHSSVHQVARVARSSELMEYKGINNSMAGMALLSEHLCPCQVSILPITRGG